MLIIKNLLLCLFLILFNILWGCIWIIGTSAPALWSIFKFDLNYWGMLIWPANLLLFSIPMILFSKKYVFPIKDKVKKWATVKPFKTD
jgi:hypothetical protein|tara:strand:+ start:240 stop:503 length:264 start_codon:yes stop_codon:yes gene_type:complete